MEGLQLRSQHEPSIDCQQLETDAIDTWELLRFKWPVYPGLSWSWSNISKCGAKYAQTFSWNFVVARTVSLAKCTCLCRRRKELFPPSQGPLFPCFLLSTMPSSLSHKSKATSHTQSPGSLWCSRVSFELSPLIRNRSVLLNAKDAVPGSFSFMPQWNFWSCLIWPASTWPSLQHSLLLPSITPHSLGLYSQDSPHLSPVRTLPSASSLLEQVPVFSLQFLFFHLLLYLFHKSSS